MPFVAGEPIGLAAAAWRAAVDGMIVVDGAGTVMAANPAAVRALAGGGATSLTGDLAAVLAPHGGSALADVLAAARAGGWRGDVVAIGRGDEAGPWELTLAPLEPGAAGGRLVGVLRDVRHLHARERERQELLSTVLHDVKGPLTVILGYAELLADPQDMPSHEALVETLGRIADCGEQIHALVSNFGLFWRMQTGRLPAERRPVDVAEIVDRVVQQHGARAAHKGITLAVDAGALPEVPGDRTQIERALANLVANAVKFAPPGGRVTVRSDCGPDAVVLTVHDTGPGIAPGEQEQIFVKYRSRAPGRRGEGIGLGLAVARGVARAHGGELTVDSAPGGGTTATLRLPLAAAAPRATA